MGMKRRYLAVLMGVMVATTSVPAMVYAENVKTERAADEASDESSEKADGSDENAQSDEAEENVVLGEVKSVSDTEITIAVGTMKEMGQPGGNGQGQTITITENTVITKQSGGMQQGQTGGDGQNGGVPEKPDGDGQGAEAEEISLSDIQEGDIVSITLDEDGNAASITVMSMEMSGQSQGVDSYTAVNEYTEDTTVSGETLESTGTDENAALISSGASVTLDNDTITRTSDSSTGGDNSSFYGVGAAVLATDGTAYVKDGSVTTDAAGGGTLYGWDLDVETNGESSAAIRSDRGGGTMVIDGGNYVSNGVGSPAIYSTADIAVSNASLTANGSEAVCIEGLNSIHLYDCDLTGNMSDLDQNDNTWTVILYQSMSGDSEVGNSTFQMDGGSLTSENGGVFYTTNTESTITLSNVDINYNDDNEFFLQCTGNTNQRGWGQSGANGADCHFTGISQDMQGNVIWDSISDLDFYLTEGSSLTGAVVDDETYAGEGGGGYCNIYVSSDSTWNVTGDSTVSALENEGTIVDSEGKTVTIQGTDGTVYVQGDSEYTITTGSYSDSVDLSGATSIQDQSAYTVEKPDQL